MPPNCLTDATSLVGLHAHTRTTDWQRTLRSPHRGLPPLPATATLADILRRDLTGDLCHGSEGHVRRQRAVAKLICEHVGDAQPADWTERRLLRALARLTEELDAAAPREILLAARRLTRKAVQHFQSSLHGRILVDAIGPPPPRGVGRATDRRLVPARHIAEVLDHGGDRLVQVALVLAHGAGFKTGQIQALEYDGVDRAGGRVLLDGIWRVLPPWAAEQLRASLPRGEEGLVFESPRKPGHPLQNLGRRLRAACERAGVEPFTYQAVRRTWQREARELGHARAVVRGTVGRCPPSVARHVAATTGDVEARAARRWLVLVDSPADRKGRRMHVPMRASNGVPAHRPEASHRRVPRTGRSHERVRAVASCLPDRWVEPFEPASTGAGRRPSGSAGSRMSARPRMASKTPGAGDTGPSSPVRRTTTLAEAETPPVAAGASWSPHQHSEYVTRKELEAHFQAIGLAGASLGAALMARRRARSARPEGGGHDFAPLDLSGLAPGWPPRAHSEYDW